jgi:RNA polymerase sigma-70 factor (ECF subfamily)
MDPHASSKAGHAEDAVRRLVAEHGGALYAIASRFCGNPTDAEDLVQEVFLQAFRGWGAFRGESSERTWLYRIAARACERMHRKRAGEPDRVASLESLLPFGEPMIAAVPSGQEGPLPEAIRKEARGRLEAEIARLPDEFRVPLLLKEIAGLSVAEVARVLNMEEATVRTRVHRARLRLRAEVDRALPRDPRPAPPPAYEERTCLDLLNAKQEALDRGVPFDHAIICDRCRSVFATLDLTSEVCRDLARDGWPDEVRERLARRLAEAADGRGRR